MPDELHSYIPLATKWGLDNKILREHLFESADNSELLEKKKKMESKMNIIKSWITDKSESTIEKDSFKLTMEAYNELGLWTWEEDNEYEQNKSLE